MLALLALLLALPLALAPRGEAFIYWGRDNGINRANLDGSGVEQMFIAGSDVWSVAVDDSHVYWTDPLHILVTLSPGYRPRQSRRHGRQPERS